MIDDRYIPLVMDYLDGTLSQEQEQELSQLLQSGALSEKELQDYARLLVTMEELPQPEPSDRLRTNFYSMLAQTEAAERKPGLLQRLQQGLGRLLWSGQVQAGMVMAGALLLVLGAGIGYWLRPANPYEQQVGHLQTQLVQMQQVLLLTQLEQSRSATDRLRAVNMSQELPRADHEVITALLNTLNSDPSINVRLAAIEALQQHAQHPQVREGLVRSFELQESPLVLIALAEAVTALQEKSAVAPMQKLLEQEQLDSTVKQQITQSIQTLL
ncbi:HEAT repeat domain-containing protein [Cesiribacter andamanensis]|uniref:Putative transmembrane transcriptional regulator (Anti-sigma factor) n=1 Tax=Cesiribacter andamanensis AMV16 TaxID=1279009 RepID=M7NKT8_9BACT|nr:HEAT repeat domain-containing protein [Cesiribacter andamanensis]EMR02405.1 putative transmembrane transcriptional regulator (anti-sigma factor) [Cesiribacter andamanensis AMV16]